MIPIISVVGKSGVGKTKFLTKLIPELTKRGYRIGVIKHDVHSKIDLPGKDSWRLTQAGAEPVLIAGPKKMALLKGLDKELSLDELALYCYNTQFMPKTRPVLKTLQGSEEQGFEEPVDLILTEGYKKENKPKIEICSDKVLLCNDKDELLAVVNAERINSEVKKIADMVEKKFLQSKKKQGTNPVKNVKLLVNGRVVPLNPFVKDFISSTIVGMLKPLKGIKGIVVPKTVSIL